MGLHLHEIFGYFGKIQIKIYLRSSAHRIGPDGDLVEPREIAHYQLSRRVVSCGRLFAGEKRRETGKRSVA